MIHQSRNGLQEFVPALDAWVNAEVWMFGLPTTTAFPTFLNRRSFSAIRLLNAIFYLCQISSLCHIRFFVVVSKFTY
ncbi:MAG: hypothetical protein D4R64_02140 [Porphyromonadaceae bacterium]|nr:MAG: hypothetical protein D4R64_02140 [Porphyromonadaceae bacterium]